MRHALIRSVLALGLLAGCPEPTVDLSPATVCGDGVVGDGEVCDDGNGVGGDGCNATCTSEEFCGNGIVDRGEQCEDGGTVDGDGCSSTCQLEVAAAPARCGDGTTDPGEQCDDGNLDAGDGCSALCRTEGCGNGILDPGEGCEDGGTAAGDGCSATCQPERVEACGDGTLDPGEDCDDGDRVAGDGCSPFCTVEECGNGILDPGEQCEDGNTASGDGCDTDCMIERTDTCGDGSLDPGEQCDDGANAAGDGCSPSCRREECGNGVLDPGEACEDGNTAPGDGCDGDCQREDPPACGDGTLDVGEECDDGDTISGDGCNAFCRTERCGNGILEPGEACEDGNAAPGDGCDADCAVEIVEGAICGNSAVEAGEECDDGARIPGDGCNAFCRTERCGNGILDPGEGCEDGNTAPGDGCDASCRIEVVTGGGGGCGNGTQDPGEECDDGGRVAGDGCSPYCTIEACGNGILDPGEVCEDGNEVAGDGCRADCLGTERCGDGLIDVGEACDGGVDCTPSCQVVGSLCGNGAVDPGEGCDDGGLMPGDGCDGSCRIETCGNGTREGIEACDDGDLDDGDDCPTTCQLARCGDGFVRVGLEACDDGNRTNGDGCDALCRVETCGNGRIDAGEQCDDGNLVTTDACTAACRPATCGDGVVWAGVEVCDDGNDDSGDGCRGDCRSDEQCGNGLLDPGEQCDDGDLDDGDACPTTCEIASCGDGFVERGVEGCDDGNDITTDACNGCVPTGCGNGLLEPGELCDEGGANGTQGAGCSAACIPARPRLVRLDDVLIDSEVGQGAGPRSVALGDVDGDGFLDALVGTNDDGALTLLTNRRDGRLQPAVRTATGTAPDALAVGFFNGDAFPDLVVANEVTDNVSVLFGDGVSFVPGPVLAPSTNRDNPEAVVVARVDTDPHDDLVWTHTFSDSVAVSFGNGDGTFTTPVVYGTQGDGPVDVGVGEFTGDTFPDLITVNRDDDTISLLAGQSNRTFTPAVTFSTRVSAAGDSPRQLVLADVSGDGVADVIVTAYSSSDVTVLVADGAGGFGTPRPFATANVGNTEGRNPWGLDVVDLDADGQPEILATAATDAQLVILKGVAGGATFGAPVRVSTRDPDSIRGGNPLRVAHGDVDRDGDIDVVTVNSGGDDITVFKNDGAGTLTATGWFASFDGSSGGSPSDIALLDVDADGELDAVLTDRSANRVYVLHGYGDGTFIAPMYRSFLGGVSQVAIRQLGGDLRPDLFAVDPSGNRLALMRQSLGGVFAESTFFVSSLQDDPNQFALGDLDGDGFVDMCVSADPDDLVGWLYLDPADADGFVTSHTLNAARDTQGITLADVVGNSALDLIVTAPDTNEVYVYAGTGARGNGAFQTSAAVVLSTRVGTVGGNQPWRVIAVDVTGDGLLDLLTVNLGSDDVTVLPSGLSKGVYDAADAYTVPMSAGGTNPGLVEVAVGDLDGDGELDLVGALEERDAVGIVFGFGGGVFSEPRVVEVGGQAVSVAVGDMDGDGLDDIVTANRGADTVTVLLSEGIDG